MKNILVFSLFFATTSYGQDNLFKRVSCEDSIRVVNEIKGDWKSIFKGFLPISGNMKIKPEGTIFNINSDRAIIVKDTLRQPTYVIEEVTNDWYLAWAYDLSTNGVRRKYRITISSKVIPSYIENYNPNYTMETEFVLLDNRIYYDEEGAILKFAKLK